jgi:hypothetical protein
VIIPAFEIQVKAERYRMQMLWWYYFPVAAVWED